MKTLNILIIEGFYGGSHKKWADQLAIFSNHNFEILSLPDRFWKWRMHGGAVTLAELFLKKSIRPDLLLFTDMIDVSVFLSLTRSVTHSIPTVLYFHENQVTYPWSQNDKDVKLNRDNHYGFINYTSALCVDQILFNSKYHKSSFIDALPKFLKQFPDHQNLESVTQIEAKSSVIAVGIDCKQLNKYVKSSHSKNNIKTLLWNHRWEYDKDPEFFFDTLTTFSNEHIPFKLIVLGEHTTSYPKIFDDIQTSLADQIVHFGYVESTDEYYRLVSQADIIAVTSKQDFFGISIVEAMHLGVHPLLPNRLAYPEHIPTEYKSAVLYNNADEFKNKLKNMLVNKIDPINLRPHLEQYDWPVIANKIDTLLVNDL